MSVWLVGCVLLSVIHAVFLLYSFARLRGMEVSSEAISNDFIRSLFSSFVVRSPSKNSFNNFMVAEVSSASNDSFVDSHLLAPYRGVFRRSTIERSDTCCWCIFCNS